MDLLILLTRSSKMENRLAALCVLRNISFHQLNRPRLLGSGMFIIFINAVNIRNIIAYVGHSLSW